MRFGLVTCLFLLIAGQAVADVPPGPSPRPYRGPFPGPFDIPGPVAAPVNFDPPDAWPLVDAAVTLTPLPKDKNTIVVEIPRYLFNEIKKAALDEDAPDRRGELTPGPRHTAMAGVAMSLAIVTGGLWLSRRGLSSWTRTTLGVGATAFFLTAASLVTWASPPPTPAPFQKVGEAPKDRSPRISINVVKQGQTVRLHLPAAMINAKPAN